MLERVVESWLTSATERTFETPFWQWLASDGYEIIHLSRHGPFEQGKDVIAIDPDGTPCVFQLKNVQDRLTQSRWERFVPQVRRLVETPIDHPSVDQDLPRRAIFVVNGELEEEVRDEIRLRNEEWERLGYPELETIVKGQILTGFKNLQSDFWPISLKFENDLLSLYLSNGKAIIDKPQLSAFLQQLLPVVCVNQKRAHLIIENATTFGIESRL